jgi:hypothetical protein
MADRNGTSVRVLSLGDLSPRTRKIEIVRDGETVYLDGYVEGRRCPASVKVAVAAASDPVMELPDDASRGVKEAAWLEYLRTKLMAVVRGLEWNEADVLAGDPDQATSVLAELGWEQSDEPETADPEVKGEAESSTTDQSSQTLPVSTGSARRKRSTSPSV